MELNQVYRSRDAGRTSPTSGKEDLEHRKCTHEHWWAEKERNRILCQQWIWAWRDGVEENNVDTKTPTPPATEKKVPSLQIETTLKKPLIGRPQPQLTNLSSSPAISTIYHVAERGWDYLPVPSAKHTCLLEVWTTIVGISGKKCG